MGLDMTQKMKSCQELIDAVDRDQPQLLLRSLLRLKWDLSSVKRDLNHLNHHNDGLQ
jgi:hypothetical protein